MNMRKIIAVLAAALMLCAAIPMGALSVAAAPGDVIADLNFDDGSCLFNRSVNENGYIVFDASTADYENTWTDKYAHSFAANTDYVVTFKAKASKDTTMNFKINDSWDADAAAFTVNVTTEWQEFEGTINMASIAWAVVMFSSNDLADAAATYYIDDVKIVEKAAVVGQIVNGDFETGEANGWNLPQQGGVSAEAAYSGSYGINIKGNGGWGGMLDQTIAVNAGKTYEVSLWLKVISNGANVQIKDGSTSGANLDSAWIDANKAGDWTQFIFTVTPTQDSLTINFCGGGNGTAEDVYVDDVVVAELKVASFDGFIYNGDFEIGEGHPWTLYGGSVVDAAAAKDGEYGLHVQGNGGWGGTAFQDFTVEVGKTYVVTMDAKAIAQGQNIQVQNPAGGATVASNWYNKAEWNTLTFEFTATDASVRINICGGGTGSNEEIYVDNVLVVEKADQPEQPDEPSIDAVWSVNFNDGDKKFNVGDVVAEGPDGSYCYKWEFSGGYGSNWTGGVRLDYTKDYTVTMKVKGSIDSNMGITLMPGDWSTWWNGPSFDVTTEWQEVVLAIPANSVSFNTGVFEFQGVGNDTGYTLYVDDIVIIEGLPEMPSGPSYDGYIYNGDFETGEITPWNNLWGSCPTVEIVEGMDGGYGLHIVSGQWKHVRQTGIAVEANTDYKITAWVKNANSMSLLVKDGGDSKDLKNIGVSAGEEWTLFEGVFTTREYTTIIFSLMGGEGEEGTQYGTFDNIKIEKIGPHTCEYVGEETTAATCTEDGEMTYTCECGASYTEVIPAGHKYYYECDAYCMNCGEETNPRAKHSKIHVEAKEAVSCIEFGNIEYWYCEYCNTAWLDEAGRYLTNMKSVMTAGECISDSPACKDGVCINCGLPCLAEAEHEYDDDYDADCNVCGDIREVPEKPVEIIYGDADGDGEITALDVLLLQEYFAGNDVTPDEVAADADGDGELTALDVLLLQEYFAGNDVTLGPV